MNDHVTFEPAPVAVAAGPRTATRTQAAARIGLLGIGAAAVLAAAILAFGYVASPTGTLAAGSTDDATTSAGILELGGGRGGHGFGHMFGGITITAISGNSISLETKDGWTRTITVDADTTFTKGGDDVALGDLAVGDQIGFRQTLEDDGSWTIDAVAVILPHVGGEVTAVNGSTITVEQRDGTAATITVNADTEYTVNGEDAALADIEVGMFLVAEGEEDAGGGITAATVKAAEPGELGGPGHRFRFGPGGPRDLVPDAPATPDEDASAS
jgi:hypothetical protein